MKKQTRQVFSQYETRLGHLNDTDTRQLNACIDAYNLVRDTYHVQTE